MSKQLLLLAGDKKISASVEDIVTAKLNNFQGWTCYTGLQNLYIDYDGNVWNGNCSGSVGKWLLKHNKPAWGNLGNIVDGFKIPSETVTCPYKNCGCGSDIVTTKYKDNTAIKFINDSATDVDAEFVDIQEISAVKVRFPVAKQILWDIGRQCNYNCSYCWPDVHNTTDPHKPLELLKHTADNVINNWSDSHIIRWYFGGGEPTLNPDFEPFVEYLSAKHQWIMLVSNGSQGPKYWQKNCDNYNVLIFSAHFESFKEDLFIKNFIAVSTVLANNSKKLSKFIIKLMTKPGEIRQSIELTDKLKSSTESYNVVKSKAISFEMVPLRGLGINSGSVLSDYTPEELEQILEFNRVNQ